MNGHDTAAGDRIGPGGATVRREPLLRRLRSGIWRRRWLVAVTTCAVIGGAALAERNSPRVANTSNEARLAARLLVPTTRSSAELAQLRADIDAAHTRQAKAHEVAERAKAAIETDPARAATVNSLILSHGYEPLPTTDLDKLIAEITRAETDLNAARVESPANVAKTRRASDWLNTLLAGYRVVSEREENEATARVTDALGALARASQSPADGAQPAEVMEDVEDDGTGTTERVTAFAALVIRATAIGFTFGVIAAALFELFDRRLRSPAHVLRSTGLAVIGSVPQTTSASATGLRLASMIDRAAFRTARGILSTLVGGPVDERSGVLLVASALPGEGRSTLAVAMAAALASVGEHVALVDADSADPVQHHRLNLPEIGGFTAALEDPSTVQMFVRTNHLDGFDLLPFGRPVPELRKKLAGPAMKELLANLRDTYAYVIVDAGPLLLSQEARLVAACCDAAVFVVHADQTRPKHTAVAHTLIKRLGLPVVGTVVNAVPDDHRRRAFDSSAAAPEPTRRRERRMLPAPEDDDEHELHLA